MDYRTRTAHRPHTQSHTQNTGPQVCPVCGAMVEHGHIGAKSAWRCLNGGYAHYYQSRYAHLEQWFTSGQGNLREPIIAAMNDRAA